MRVFQMFSPWGVSVMLGDGWNTALRVAWRSGSAVSKLVSGIEKWQDNSWIISQKIQAWVLLWKFFCLEIC